MRSCRILVKRAAISLSILLAISYAVAWLILSNLSITTHGSVNLDHGNIPLPTERTREWADSSALLDSTIDKLARKYATNLEFGTKDVDHLIVQLAANRHIEQVNTILQEATPWGEVGSDHDYDFALCGLTLMLYNFGDQPEILYPESVAHLVSTLLTEKGGTPALHPIRRGLSPLKFLPMTDTENHILMTEGSRFLTNQWIANSGDRNPRYDNSENGLEDWLLEFLSGLEKAGIHEYNSIPYEGYTLRSLLNLASFAEGPVGNCASRVLDRMTWDYSLGSLSFRRFAPFRRQPILADEPRLDAHYQTAMMKGWMSLAGIDHLELHRVPHHAMWVKLTTYRPPDAVYDWVMAKASDYFVQIGHGDDGSPEVYSGGPGYLITAGGVANAVLRDNVARPTTLMLEDGAIELKDLLHIKGPGRTYREWNNTGVHRRLAVAAGPVSVPEAWEPSLQQHGWSFYERSGKRIAVYSTANFGLFCLLPEAGDFATEATKLTTANADLSELVRVFRWPEGSTLTYDVGAKKNDWVIVSVDHTLLDRDHGEWPLMKGDIEATEPAH